MGSKKPIYNDIVKIKFDTETYSEYIKTKGLQQVFSLKNSKKCCVSDKVRVLVSDNMGVPPETSVLSETDVDARFLDFAYGRIAPFSEKLCLPNKDELEDYVKRCRKDKNYDFEFANKSYISYSFGHELPIINADWLLQVLKCFDKPTAYTQKLSEKNEHPLVKIEESSNSGNSFLAKASEPDYIIIAPLLGVTLKSSKKLDSEGKTNLKLYEKK